MASRSSTVMAPCTLSWRARSGMPCRSTPKTMLPSRMRRSASDVARQKMAITSLATTMSKPSSRGCPLMGPPSPTTVLRRARSFMSITRFQRMRVGSMPSALP